jgi:LacI family transcriptional regulator
MRVTSHDVARRAGVSRSTVSFVLNGVRTDRVSDATRERVLRAARELSYIPDAAARTLVSGKTSTIGLVVSRAEHIRVDGFVPQILHSLAQVCSARNHRLILETSDPGQSTYEYDQLAGSRQIDGLVVLNPDPLDDRLAALIEREFPIVLIGSHPHPCVPTVAVDSVLAMRHATEHVIGLGHRRIGFIHYREVIDLGMGGRFKGYRVALEAAGIPFDERWVRSGNFNAESGHEAMLSLLDEAERPTAVVMGNDTIALGAMSAVVESGLRVPDDVAIVGFDDIPLARYAVPALTTVRLPASEMAEACGHMILDLIADGKVDSPKRWFPAELVVRLSCGHSNSATSPSGPVDRSSVLG